jgi:hypothetical protein
MNNAEKYREELVEQIKDLSVDLNNLASDLVGTSDLITNFEIHLKFSPDSTPTIELVREHLSDEFLRRERARTGHIGVKSKKGD